MAKGSSTGSAKPASRKATSTRGTKAVLVVGMFFPIAEGQTRVSVCRVKIMPSRRSSFPIYKVCPPPDSKGKRSATQGSSAPSSRAGDTEDLSEGAEGKTGEQVIAMSGTGKDVQYHPISGPDLAAYHVLRAEVLAAKGIHVEQNVSAAHVHSYAIENVFFLAPEDVGDSMIAYQLIHQTLWTGYRALVGRLHRKDGVVPIAITAAEGGLVMYQLAPVGATHNMLELLNASAWQAVTPLPQHRTAVGTMIGGITANRIDPLVIEDPITQRIRGLVDGMQRPASPILPCSDKSIPNLEAALRAMQGGS